MHQKFTEASIQMVNTGAPGIIAISHHLVFSHWTGLKAWVRPTEIFRTSPYRII